jgi:hypothetical protein
MYNNFSQIFSKTATAMVSPKTFSKIILFLFLFCSNVALATPPGFDDDVNDEAPPAAIDSYLILLCIVGVILGFYLLRKKELLKIIN